MSTKNFETTSEVERLDKIQNIYREPLVGQGVIVIKLVILREYLWRTYDEARGRPSYIVEGHIRSADVNSRETDGIGGAIVLPPSQMAKTSA